MALIAPFAPMARSTNRSTTYSSREPIPTTQRYYWPKRPGVVARAISMHGHLSLARPTAMLSLAVIAARPAHDF